MWIDRPVQDSGNIEDCVAVPVVSFGSRISETNVPVPAQFDGGVVPFPPVPFPELTVNFQISKLQPPTPEYLLISS